MFSNIPTPVLVVGILIIGFALERLIDGPQKKEVSRRIEQGAETKAPKRYSKEEIAREVRRIHSEAPPTLSVDDKRSLAIDRKQAQWRDRASSGLQDPSAQRIKYSAGLDMEAAQVEAMEKEVMEHAALPPAERGADGEVMTPEEFKVWKAQTQEEHVLFE